MRPTRPSTRSNPSAFSCRARSRMSRSRWRLRARATSRFGPRRRHQPMRPDGQSRPGPRLLEISPQRAGGRPRSPTREGRAGHRARPSQRGAQTPRPLLSRRSVDACALHHRGHGGQQFLRQQVDPLRPDGRQCRGHRRNPGRRRAIPLRSRLARTRRDEAGRHRRTDGPAADARTGPGAGDRRSISASAAPGWRVQYRCVDAGRRRRGP